MGLGFIKGVLTGCAIGSAIILGAFIIALLIISILLLIKRWYILQPEYQAVLENQAFLLVVL